jgi:hypothetical protein
VVPVLPWKYNNKEPKRKKNVAVGQLCHQRQHFLGPDRESKSTGWCVGVFALGAKEPKMDKLSFFFFFFFLLSAVATLPWPIELSSSPGLCLLLLSTVVLFGPKKSKKNLHFCLVLRHFFLFLFRGVKKLLTECYPCGVHHLQGRRRTIFIPSLLPQPTTRGYCEKLPSRLMAGSRGAGSISQHLARLFFIYLDVSTLINTWGAERARSFCYRLLELSEIGEDG